MRSSGFYFLGPTKWSGPEWVLANPY